MKVRGGEGRDGGCGSKRGGDALFFSLKANRLAEKSSNPPIGIYTYDKKL